MEENKSLCFKEINEILKDNYAKLLFTFFSLYIPRFRQELWLGKLFMHWYVLCYVIISMKRIFSYVCIIHLTVNCVSIYIFANETC